MKNPDNFHRILGNSTPGHPPTTSRSTPKPAGIPVQNPRPNIPHVVPLSLAPLGNLLSALGAKLGRK